MSIFPDQDITKKQLKAQIAELKRLQGWWERTAASRDLRPFEERQRASETAQLADLQFHLDSFDAIEADKPKDLRPYTLVLNLWGRVYIWACDRCGTGVVSDKRDGRDWRDLHDQHCPAA